METVRLNISLNDKSLDDTIKRLKTMRKYLLDIEREFIIKSLNIIKDKASALLDSRVYSFPNTANVNDYWKIEITELPNGYVGKLWNENEIATYIEFGTGLVGETFKHRKANELNYEYDVNQHGIKGWNWYNEDIGVGMKGFVGYEGKSFLYDASWDYIYNREYIVIYQEIFDRYMKKVR